MVSRYQDWPTRLSEFLMTRGETPFEYGANDCCLFVADAVLAMTGVDFAAADFRGRYKTEAGAYKALKKFGGGGIAGMMEEFCRCGDFEEVAPAYAGRGDVVLVNHAGLEALGVVDLSGTQAMVTGPEGMVRLPLGLATRGWKLCQR